MEVTSRHHLRSDAVRDLESALLEEFGIDLDGDGYELVELDDDLFDLVLVDGQPHVCYLDGEPAPTVQGANAYQPTNHVVTVDAGAVEFVSNGADVMRPGIVDADESIEPGDLVAITEETHGKVLAIGRAGVAGSDMVGDSGKVIDSIHHVGDELYSFSV